MAARIPLKFLVLMLTSRCNLGCAYCYAEAGPGGDDLPRETALAALELFAPPQGWLTVELAGGEPLLRFELVRELVESAPARRGRLRFALQTNGLLLDEEKARFLAGHGVGLGLSLDGTPRINDLTRGGGEGTERALRLLSELGMGANLTVVLTRRNVEHLPEFLLFCGGYPCLRVVNLDLVRPLGRARGQELAPEPDQLSEVVPAMLKALEFINQRRFPPLKVREVDQTRRRIKQGRVEAYCFAAQGLAAAVTPAGELYACASLAGREEFAAGTVEEPQPGVLRDMARCLALPPGCRNCPVAVVCRGGCPSRRVAYNGRADRRTELECRLRKELFRRLT